MYHGHTHEVRDVNAGLIDPMIVTRRDAAWPDGTPRDVDRELVIGFIEVDENNGMYRQHNLHTYVSEPDSVRIDTSCVARATGPSTQYHFKETDSSTATCRSRASGWASRCVGNRQWMGMPARYAVVPGAPRTR